MAKEQVLVRSEFRDWLETLPADHEFTRCDSMKCPLGQYFRKALGYINAGVGMDTYYYNGSPSHQLPEWAYDFVRNFDGLMGWNRTATQAREVLNAIPETE